MRKCEERTAQIQLYLDNELKGNELEEFTEHANCCVTCQAELQDWRFFLEDLHSLRPLYFNPPDLRSRVENIVNTEIAMSSTVMTKLRSKVKRIIKCETMSPSFFWAKAISGLTVIAVVASAALALLKLSEREAHALTFVDIAVKLHEDKSAGRLPIQCKTNSPSVITEWFANKVPFHFRLPNAQEPESQNIKYTLIGGRLVDFNDKRIAYVAYQVRDQLISLLVAAASDASASGGETTVSTDLTFHSHSKNGLHAVTWSAHNLTYALVSSVTLPAGNLARFATQLPKIMNSLKASTNDLLHEPGALL
jgi:anti-sigma factor RsiW